MTKAEVSVVIPTRNGGDRFRSVLETVLAQESSRGFEVVVVDSSSDDGTPEVLERMAAKDSRLTVHAIALEDFGHGKTRNFAIERTSGQYIAMLTQDAMPASDRWLDTLVEGLCNSDDMAGVVGRQIPYADAPLCSRRELYDHFERLKASADVIRIDDPDRYAEDESLRQVLHFFSDNNAALKRSVWEEIPYPDVPFGEDQLWAESVIKAGYAKAYRHDAVVYHSHAYSVREMYLRQREEAKYYGRAFGYRIVPTLRDVPRTAYDHIRADINYRNLQSDASATWAALAGSGVLNVARALGQYAGGRDAAISGDGRRRQM
jgi:rhamnosyltransferase